MDYNDLECQKRLIKTFINSVFVYDDKVVLKFNYSGDRRTITLMEIDAGLQQGVRLQSDVDHQKRNTPKGVFLFLHNQSGIEPERAFCVNKTVQGTVFSKKVRGFIIRAVKIFVV